MPFIEIITPSTKQGAATQAALRDVFSFFSGVLGKVPGLIQSVNGKMKIENGTIVSPDVSKLVLSVEWENPQNFYDVLETDDFKTFIGKLLPCLDGPATPGLYEVNAGPAKVINAAISEVFRIEVKNGKDSEIQRAFETYTRAIEALSPTGHPEISTFDGISLNLDTPTFVGAVGYDAEELYKKVQENEHVAAAKATLQRLGATWFLTSLTKL